MYLRKDRNNVGEEKGAFSFPLNFQYIRKMWFDGGYQISVRPSWTYLYEFEVSEPHLVLMLSIQPNFKIYIVDSNRFYI